MSESKDLNGADNDLETYKDEKVTVKELALSQGEYVLHGISLALGGQRNAVISNEATWQDKLAVLSELKPTISGVRVEYNDKRSFYTWFPFGVVLKNGRIESAHLGDQGSEARSITERISNFQYGDAEDYKEALSTKKTGEGYSEVIIAKPEIAGLYLNLDEIFRFGEKNYIDYRGHPNQKVSFTEIYTEAKRYGMRVFAFSNGTAHKATLDENGKIVLGKEVSPEAMMDEKYSVPDESKDIINKQALRVVPFEREKKKFA